MAKAGRRPDPIQLVEAAYTWEPDEGRWLERIVATAAAYQVGGGVIACTVRIDQRTEILTLRRSEGADERNAFCFRSVTEQLSPELGHELCAPTELVGNTLFRFARVARERNLDVESLICARGVRMPNSWALVGGDTRERALILCFPQCRGRDFTPEAPFPHRDRHALGLVGAHIGAALRLRSLIAPAANDAATEAVLGPGGRVLHAAAAARSSRARASIVEAVRSSERARSRLRRAEPEEALQAWTALVQGRWTIIDTVERDGRRMLLARRNPLSVAGILDLTPDERDVAWLAAMGHSFKYIAYELGHPIPTIAGRLGRAMRKLRVGSRTELLGRLGVAHGERKAT